MRSISKYLTALSVSLWCLAGCSGEQGGVVDEGAGTPAGGEAARVVIDASARFEALAEAYFEELLALEPVFATFIGDNRFNDELPNDIGPDYLAARRGLDERYLESLRAIGPEGLNGQELISYEILEAELLESLEGYRYPSRLIPVNQRYALPNYFVMLGSGGSLQPFVTVEDYDNFLGRVRGFGIWVDQAIANMREGVEKGIVQPRVIMERTLPQLAAQIHDDAEDSTFWTPIRNLPETFPAAERERLTAAYRAAIEEVITPAYRRLSTFIEDEYLPHTRETVGLVGLPGGEEWYAYLVRSYTTTSLTADEIHEIGLAEVARIQEEMRRVIAELGFDGDLSEFFAFLNEDPRFYFTDEDDLLNGYRAMKQDLAEKALKLFDGLPRADFEIRPVEAFRARSAAGGSYFGATPDGSRPGVFYVNTYDLSARPSWAMESLFLHEAIPGHHFQGALALELDDLPRFRRFGSYTAYGEGWGLYAESLGKELGVYQDPHQYFGALAAELFRAIRLVVDTGLHARGWTREQVLDYMYANIAVKPARAESETERYISTPGQALAYKIGQLKLRELRDRAEQALGDDFDIKAFHRQILVDGELPLHVLEKKIDRWILNQQQNTGK